MAKIPILKSFKPKQKDLLKIKTADENTVLMSKSEFREHLIDYIDKELDLISSGVTKRKANKIIKNVDNRLIKFEKNLKKHIDYKINQITERVIETELLTWLKKK